MNETLYRWTFKFHKVVQQQNSGAVEDFILPYSAVYLRIQKWNNYWNRSAFAKVIVKIKVARFYGPRCISSKILMVSCRQDSWSYLLFARQPAVKVQGYQLNTRNALHCDQSNVYSSRTIFSSTRPMLLSHSFRFILYYHPLRNVSNIPNVSTVMHSARGQSVVSGRGSGVQLLRYSHLKFFKMWDRSFVRQYSYTSYTDVSAKLGKQRSRE